MQPDDEIIIAQFLQGERAAVKIIDGWIAQAARPFQRRLASDWEDVLQEIRLSLARLLQQGAFRREASLKTYLWRVVNHACIDHLRARQKHQWYLLDEVSDQQGSPADSPFERLAQKETVQLLFQVLAQMSEECRQLWHLILAGLSYQQMSDRLAVPEGALRVKVLRCRRKAVAVREQLLARKQNVGL